MNPVRFSVSQFPCHGLFYHGLFCLFLMGGMLGCNREEAATPGDVLDESWFSLTDEKGSSPAAAPDAPASNMEAKANLAINLKQGDRFPLQKVVEKTLTQSTLQGPIENTERIELQMSVTVEEIRQQNKKFRIQYNRVKYSSQLNGQRIEYDSTLAPTSVPDHVLAYHGMVNNGFSFWVGPDNKITDVVDFNEFLQRCLVHIPAHKADVVAQILAGYSSQQDGIANFVDDTIGLLPYNPNSPDGSSVVRLGGHWSKSRNFNDPVPMSLNNTYTLRELNDDYARIEVIGDIIPAAGVSHAGQTVTLQVKQGHAAGTCTIDRRTGLPLNSHIDHQLSMLVQANGIEIEQQKRVVTSIKMFLEQRPGQVEQITVEHGQSPSATGLTVTPAGHTLQQN